MCHADGLILVGNMFRLILLALNSLRVQTALIHLVLIKQRKLRTKHKREQQEALIQEKAYTLQEKVNSKLHMQDSSIQMRKYNDINKFKSIDVTSLVIRN